MQVVSSSMVFLGMKFIRESPSAKHDPLRGSNTGKYLFGYTARSLPATIVLCRARYAYGLSPVSRRNATLR